MSNSLKGAIRKKIPEPQNKKISERQSNLRSVLSPIENIRKCHTISKKGQKTDISSLPAKTILSPGGINSDVQSRLVEYGPTRGYVTILDRLMKENKLYPITSTIPQKKLVFNSYQQKCHVERWKSWVTDTPNWILKMALDKDEASTSRNSKLTNKENNHCENERMNTDTSLDEMELDSSGILESEDEKNDSIHDTVITKWRDWSIQLSDNGNLFITGKIENDGAHLARDVTSCERVDSNTLKFSNGVIYELEGMPDHFTNLPYYIRNKFQCGFPSDWKKLRELWIRYVKEESPFDFGWSMNSSGSPNSNKFDTSLTTPKHKSLIPVKLTTGHNTVPVKNSQHSKLCTLAQTQPRAFPDSIKRSYSPTVIEDYKCICPRMMKESGDQLPEEGLVECTEKMDINKSSDKLSGSSRQTDNSLLTKSKIKSPRQPQISDKIKNVNTVEKVHVNQEVVLCNWTPMLVNDTDMKIKGYIVGSEHPDEPHITNVIEARKSFESFRCVNGGSYKLQGKFVDPENSIPDKIKKKLVKGLPSHWKSMIKKWNLETEKNSN